MDVRLRERWRCIRLSDAELPGHCHFSSLCHTPGDILVSVIRS